MPRVHHASARGKRPLTCVYRVDIPFSRHHRREAAGAVNNKRKVKQELDHMHEFTIGRKTLVPGTEVSLRGKRGRYRFQYARKTSGGLDELTFVGGPSGREQFVSAYPDKVSRVHRSNTTPRNIQLLKGNQ